MTGNLVANARIVRLILAKRVQPLEDVMKIAIYGATGMIGSRVLAEALRRGHAVTAVVRDPKRVEESSPTLTVTTGDILDARSVANSVAGVDAVISAWGPGHGGDVGDFERSSRALVDGLTAVGVKRLVIVGGAGSLEVAPGVQLVDTPEFPDAWEAPALAHREVLRSLPALAESLDWTYVSPSAFIQPGERTGKFRLGTDTLLTGSDGQSRVSAEDFAIALIDEVETPQYIKRRFTVGY